MSELYVRLCNNTLTCLKIEMVKEICDHPTNHVMNMAVDDNVLIVTTERDIPDVIETVRTIMEILRNSK